MTSTLLELVVVGMKDRLLIASDDDAYNDSLNNSGNEAIDYVNMRLKPYNDSVTNDTTNKGILIAITCDIGSGIFKRRHMPKDFDTEGWLKLGIQKLEQYIKNTYFKGRIYIVGEEE